MTDLVEFLDARLAEDESAARQALTDPDNNRGQGVRIVDGELAIMPSAMSNGLTVHFVRYSPARVLREVEAKRRILARHHRRGPLDYIACVGNDDMCVGCGNEGEFEDPVTPNIDDCPELRDLAAVYADHPDYQQQWKP